MPDLSRLAIRDFALAFGIGGGCVAMMLMGNVGGLRDMSFATGHGLLTVLLMWGLAGTLISGAMGLVDSFGRDDDDHRPHSGPGTGRRAQRQPVRIRVTRDRRR